MLRIARALERASGPPPAGEVWIGDDAAVLQRPAGRLVLAADAAVAGIHGNLGLVGLDDLGWKGLTATLSDIGAVGARPSHALVTLCLPPGTDVDVLASGLAAASAAWACPVVGGDVTGSEQVVVSVAATGVLEGDRPPVLRSGAAPGDHLFCTGPLGGSAAGLRVLRSGGALPEEGDPEALVRAHRRPRARIDEGVAARSAGATAMIDVSDGLALDVDRLARASRVGVRLDAVPVVAGATADEALSGGEDYELVVATADPERLAAAFSAAGLRAPVAIGRCTATPAERLLAGEPFEPRGWSHAVGQVGATTDRTITGR